MKSPIKPYDSKALEFPIPMRGNENLSVNVMPITYPVSDPHEG